MSQFTPAMQTALAQPTVLIFGALKVQLNTGPVIRLLDGSSTLSFGGDTFSGKDPTFGALAAIDAIEDGVGDEAPGLSITLHPSSDAAAATLSAATMQGSPVSLWIGAIDQTTRAVIADPLLLFFGELDQPTITVDKGERVLEYECVSAFERLFENDEGVRLADSFHQSVWLGETGLANVTGIVRTAYWGTEAPPSSVSYYGGGGFGGSGGGSGGGGRFNVQAALEAAF
jgi:hypothetical protein